MEGRQGVGAVLVVVGIGMAVLGGTGLLGASSPTAMHPTQSVAPPGASPTGAGAPTATAVVTPPPPTAAPTQDTLAVVRAFFARLQADIQAGHQGDLADSLAAAVIARYGRDACATALAAKPPVPEQAFEIIAVRPPAPWDYVTDGLTTTIPDTTAVDAHVTGPDPSGTVTTEPRELHVQVVDGAVHWFTDCGDPLSAP
jgi:hypothetical protein